MLTTDHVTKILITDMPGPSIWEFLMQWGGMLVQAASALGTLWAVVVALRVSSTQSQWREQESLRETVVVSAIVGSELKQLGHPLSLLITQFGGENTLADWVVPAHAQAIASTCAERLELPKTWQLVDKVGFLPEAKRVALLMGSLPTLQKGCETEIRKMQAGHTDREGLWKLGQFAHLLEWHRRKALHLEIDPNRFKYRENEASQ